MYIFIVLRGHSDWRTYIVGVRKLVHRYNAYSLYRCFPSIPGVGYGEEFQDVGDRSSYLDRAYLSGWLVSDHLTECTSVGISVIRSRTSLAALLVSLDMTSFTLAILILIWHLWGV